MAEKPRRVPQLILVRWSQVGDGDRVYINDSGKFDENGNPILTGPGVVYRASDQMVEFGGRIVVWQRHALYREEQA